MADLINTALDKPFLLFWGPPMSGKTVLATQFPKPTLINLDKNLNSVMALRAKYGLSFNFRVFTIDESPTEDPEFLSLCGANFGKLMPWEKFKKIVEVLGRKMDKDETLIIDSITRAGEYLVRYLIKITGHKPLQIQDWGTYVDEFQTFTDSVKTSACKPMVILIGHDRFDKMEGSGDWRRTLIIPTSARDRIPSIVTESLYMKIDIRGSSTNRKVKRILQSLPDPVTTSGSRSLMPDIEYPTYAKMRPYLEAGAGYSLGEPTWTPPVDE
ncbi:MAG TPA: AAA family ATPase [Paludibacteraceae bacterium]|nr:AAA family ATPase [Paludibacteraceae bacterium]